MPLNVDSVWLVIGVDSPEKKKQLLPFPISSLESRTFRCVDNCPGSKDPMGPVTNGTLPQAYGFAYSLARDRSWGTATCEVFYSAMAVSKASWD